MIDSFSTFYYGHTIARDNRFLNFSEGGGELSVELSPSTYTLTELLSAVQSGLNGSGANTYTLSVDRATRLVTISADATFELLVNTGSQSGQSVFELLGFTGADLTGSTSYVGNNPSGSQYSPQFKLQSYVDKTISEQGISTVINKTSEGNVEIVTFGRENFYEMDIKFITDLPMDGRVIKNNPSGLQDAIDFMSDIIGKTRFEFMPDIDDPDTYSKCILESTPGYSDGTGFKLRELFNQNLRDIYETGIIKLRVVL